MNRLERQEVDSRVARMAAEARLRGFRKAFFEVAERLAERQVRDTEPACTIDGEFDVLAAAQA